MRKHISIKDKDRNEVATFTLDTDELTIIVTGESDYNATSREVIVNVRGRYLNNGAVQLELPYHNDFPRVLDGFIW